VADKAQAIRDEESRLRLFNRTVSLTIARQPTGFVASHPGYFESIGNGIEITELRVKFDVKKNLGHTPNTATITVYNLSDTTRREIESRPLYLLLRAGYDGVARLLFAGNVTFAFSRHNGTEWETKIQAGDGARAFAHAWLTKSYGKPISVRQVLADAAASMGLKLPPEAEQSPQLRQALATGISVHGPTRDTLTKLLAPYGLKWSVQNGRLVILADDQVSQTTALVINEAAGLINSPEHSIPSKPGDPSDLSFEVLVNSELNPGGTVSMDTESQKGLYKVQDVAHKGDTAGDEWTTECKALPLGQSKKKGK
jgi:hypothetical protein